MGARMVPANGQTTKTKNIFYMSFWLERLSILLQIYTFACNFCSRKGGRASIGTYTVVIYRKHWTILKKIYSVTPFKFAAVEVHGFDIMTYSLPFNFAVSYQNYFIFDNI